MNTMEYIAGKCDASIKPHYTTNHMYECIEDDIPLEGYDIPEPVGGNPSNPSGGSSGNQNGGGTPIDFAYADDSITTPVKNPQFTPVDDNNAQFITFYNGLSSEQQSIIDANMVQFFGYLVDNDFSEEAQEFAEWATIFLNDNLDLSFDDLLNSRTEFDSNQAEIDNYQEGGYDNTTYSTFNPQQSWPNIAPVIPQSDFMGWNRTLYPNWNCMDYAKDQIAKVSYQISSYYSTDQTFQIYTAQNGVNNNMLSQGLSYLHYALSNGIPVIVGVDNVSGHPGNLDNTTDHFIVIVGMGTDSNGKYFLFYDNASGHISQGASPDNKLYYNSQTGKISGQSQTTYAQNPSYYPYIITQIRKSKPL